MVFKMILDGLDAFDSCNMLSPLMASTFFVSSLADLQQVLENLGNMSRKHRQGELKNVHIIIQNKRMTTFLEGFQLYLVILDIIISTLSMAMVAWL